MLLGAGAAIFCSGFGPKTNSSLCDKSDAILVVSWKKWKRVLRLRFVFFYVIFHEKMCFLKKIKVAKSVKSASKRRKVKNHKWSKRCTNVEIKKTQSASRECFFHYFLALLSVFVFNFGGYFSGQKWGKIFFKKCELVKRVFIMFSPVHSSSQMQDS